jgi:D-alanyl-D-alanine carboxypeptidase/D-alanyl-D-alanine-endopeptidase (penicillin-binding protein 4)
MLPAGGKTGTLRNAYAKTDQPFVFGKTGSLSGVHNQSGYVFTKKGKMYLYSFLNKEISCIKSITSSIVNLYFSNFD